MRKHYAVTLKFPIHYHYTKSNHDVRVCTYVHVRDVERVKREQHVHWPLYFLAFSLTHQPIGKLFAFLHFGNLQPLLVITPIFYLLRQYVFVLACNSNLVMTVHIT